MKTRAVRAQRGARSEVQRALKEQLSAPGLAKSQARACASSCLDQCSSGVTILVEPEHFFYGRVTVADVPEIVACPCAWRAGGALGSHEGRFGAGLRGPSRACGTASSKNSEWIVAREQGKLADSHETHPIIPFHCRRVISDRMRVAPEHRRAEPRGKKNAETAKQSDAFAKQLAQ